MTRPCSASWGSNDVASMVPRLPRQGPGRGLGVHPEHTAAGQALRPGHLQGVWRQRACAVKCVICGRSTEHTVDIKHGYPDAPPWALPACKGTCDGFDLEATAAARPHADRIPAMRRAFSAWKETARL